MTSPVHRPYLTRLARSLNEGAFQPARWRLWLPVLLVALVYLPTLQAGFVWDDTIFLVDVPRYRDPALWAEALRQPFALSPNYFRPLALLTFIVELRLVGTQPWLFHLTNLLLHTLNTGLVTALAARLWAGNGDANDPWRNWLPPLVGLLYGLHPALVESVAFISSRFDLLATAGLLLALWIDLAWRQRGWARPLGVGLAVLAAALVKEMAVAMLVVLPLWHLATGEQGRRRWGMYLAAPGGLAMALGLRYALLGYVYRPGSEQALPVGDLLQHVLLVGRSLSEYVRLVLWPFTSLSPIHFSPLPVSKESLTAWLALGVVGAALAGLVGWLRRDTWSGWLGVAGVVALLPTLNLLPLELGGGAFIAERFLTFPLALMALAAGGLLARLDGIRPVRAGVGLWLVGCVAVVQLTVPYWRDDVSLWQWALRRAPQSPTPYTNLALAYVNRGDYLRAVGLAEQALRLDPKEDNARNTLGLALFFLERYPEAEAAFAEAARQEPQNALYWNNLAGALREQGKLQEAERLLLDQVLQLDPTLPTAHLNLGIVYLRADRPDLAAEHLSLAVRLLPAERAAEAQQPLEQTHDPARWLRLGDLLLNHNEPERALEAFGRAEQLGAPGLDVAVGRSAALMALGRLDEARALLQAALLSAPQDARLYNNLGLVAKARGEVEQARAFLERAVKLAPEWELPRQNLKALGASLP